MNPLDDPRIVMTLDAGGTSFRFSALRAGRACTETLTSPSHGDDLPACLAAIIRGFEEIRQRCPEPPAAISFAFPGPSDYRNGVIGDLANLPAFRGGVPLGPLLEEHFAIPVLIHNDGDLFVHGEAIGGLLPWVNAQLRQTGETQVYRNLFGITLGTGLGGGLSRNGEMFTGDNGIAAEVWQMHNLLDPAASAEEGACIRAVRRSYAATSGIPLDEVPEPKTLCEIGLGTHPGNQAAAREAFRRLGQVAGEVIATGLLLIDGLAVIGGGLAGAAPLFMPALMDGLRRKIQTNSGPKPRLAASVFNLDSAEELAAFTSPQPCTVRVPHSGRTVPYRPQARVGVGISRLGTSEAIALGAYSCAIQSLSQARP